MRFVVLFLSLWLTLYASHIDEFAKNMGYERDYEKALEQAKSEKKLLMLVMVSDYCPWCRKMERKTLSMAPVAIKMHRDFVALIVDRNHEKEFYPKEYYTPRIPTVFFIDPEKEEQIYESIGYVGYKDFKATLEDVERSYTKGDE